MAYTPEQLAQLAQQQKLSPAAQAFLQSQYGGPPPADGPSHYVPPGVMPEAPMVAPAPPPASFGAAKAGGLAAYGIPAAPSPDPAPAVVPPTPVAPVPPPPAPIGPPSPPPAMLAAPKPPVGPPAASGGGLPLQAPAAPAAPAEGLYKGLDPLHFGQSPGAQKLTGIEGRSLYGQGEYAKQAAGHDAQYATDMVGVSQGMLSQADAEAAAAEKKAADRKAFLAKYNTETEARINEYANAEIKPDRLWAGSAGTGNAISAVIGSFVSGIAGYLDPSKDYVGQFAARIDKKIAEDIDLQKAAIAKKGAGIEARRGLYGSYLQQFGQEDAADSMAHETYLRKTKAQIDSYAAKTTNEKAKTQLGAMSAAIDDKIAMWAAGRQAAGESLIDGYYAQQAKAAAAAQQAAYARDKADDDANLAILKAKGPELGGVGIIRIPYGTKLPNGTIVNNKLGMPALVDANGNYVDTGTIAAKAKAEGGGSGPKPINTTVGFNEKGQPLYGPAMKPVSPKAGDDYLERTEKLAQAREALIAMKALRAKNNGGSVIDSSKDKAEAEKYKRKVFSGIKTLGENSDKDAEAIMKVVPDPLAVDMKAGVTGGVPYTDALIDSHLASIDEEIKRLNNSHFQGAPTSPSLPLTKPAEPGK